MKKEPGEPVIEINNVPLSNDLISDIRSLIETTRHNVAVPCISSADFKMSENLSSTFLLIRL